jgi:transmembrane sensor
VGSTQRTEAIRMQEAALWWARFQEDEPDADELTAWMAWMESDDENRNAFESLNELALRIRQTRAQEPALLRDLQRPPGRVATRRLTIGIAAGVLAVSIGIAVLIAESVYPLKTGADDRESGVFSTPTAGQTDVVLPDGSRVALGGASKIDIDFSARSRRIRLTQGEAYFEVKHESGRPFVVDVGLATVRAVGTAFNIRKSDDRVDVTVTEGRIKVTREEGPIRRMVVAAGLEREQAIEVGRAEQVIIGPKSAPFAVASADPQRVTSWREGRLEFVDEPLDTVIQSVSRYANKPLVAADSRLHSMTYTGTFVPDHLDSWLSALQTVFPIEVNSEGNATTLRLRAQP